MTFRLNRQVKEVMHIAIINYLRLSNFMKQTDDNEKLKVEQNR